MGTITKLHYNNIINDDSMSTEDIRDLVDMLEEYLDGGKL